MNISGAIDRALEEQFCAADLRTRIQGPDGRPSA